MPDQSNGLPQSQVSILAVDDDAMHRRLLQLQLKTLGYGVEFAANGAEALQRWRTGLQTLIFTDLHMPVMDGLELTAAIRREEQRRGQTQIYVLTSSASPDDRDQARAAGVTGCLEKPIDLDQLGQLMDRALQMAMNQAQDRLQEA